MEEKDLILMAATLSRAAPKEWKDFLGAVEKYGDVQTRRVVQASAGDLARLQGWAQQCASLIALFGDAGKSADRIATKRAANC